MPLRAKIKKAFSTTPPEPAPISHTNSSDSSASKKSTASSISSSLRNLQIAPADHPSNTTAIRLVRTVSRTIQGKPIAPPPPQRRGLGDPKIYQPGEPMPEMKYVDPISWEHKRILDKYEFGKGPRSQAAKAARRSSRFGLGPRTMSHGSIRSVISGISPGCSRRGSFVGMDVEVKKEVARVNLVLGNVDNVGESEGAKETARLFRRRRSGMVDISETSMAQAQ